MFELFVCGVCIVFGCDLLNNLNYFDFVCVMNMVVI